jgi:hypothetical protein
MFSIRDETISKDGLQWITRGRREKERWMIVIH